MYRGERNRILLDLPKISGCPDYGKFLFLVVFTVPYNTYTQQNTKTYNKTHRRKHSNVCEHRQVHAPAVFCTQHRKMTLPTGTTAETKGNLEQSWSGESRLTGSECRLKSDVCEHDNAPWCSISVWTFLIRCVQRKLCIRPLLQHAVRMDIGWLRKHAHCTVLHIEVLRRN